MARHLRVEFPGAIYHVAVRMLGERSGKRRERPKRYREYVESGLAESDDDFKAALKESPRSIGGDGFRAWVDELYQKLVESHNRLEAKRKECAAGRNEQ